MISFISSRRNSYHNLQGASPAKTISETMTSDHVSGLLPKQKIFFEFNLKIHLFLQNGM